MFVVCASLLGWVAASAGLPGVKGVDGEVHHPLSDAGGKPVALIFISHDCPVCNTYAPEIGRIEAKYGGKVSIDIVYSEPGITRKVARIHAKEFAIDHGTLLLDPRSELAAACNAGTTPQAVAYDGSGKRVYSGRIDDRYYALGRQRPAPTSHDLSLALDAILAHRMPKAASGPPVGCVIILPHKT